MGESAPGPTGLTWALEQSDTRHAQAEGPPTERSGARACSFQPRVSSGRQPKNWFSAGTLYAAVGRWYEKYGAGQVPPGSEGTDHPRSGR